MKKILIIGSADHCAKISKSLSKEFEFKSIIISKKTILKYYLLLFWADVVLNVYPFILNNKRFAFWVYSIPVFLRKRLIIEWIGTDVLDYTHYLAHNKEPYWISRVTHLCECDWISDELRLLNIKNTVGPYLVFNSLFQNTASEVNSIAEHNGKLKVLSYVPELRANFYGFDKIIQIAQLVPDVEFTLLKIKETDIGIPDNVKLLGDIDFEQMNVLYEQHDVFLRLTEHDGLSYSVLEAMYRGQYVFFTYDYPNTIHASSIENIVSEINKLCDLKKRNQLQKNYKGINYIKENFILNQLCVKNWLKVINGV